MLHHAPQSKQSKHSLNCCLENTQRPFELCNARHQKTLISLVRPSGDEQTPPKSFYTHHIGWHNFTCQKPIKHTRQNHFPIAHMPGWAFAKCTPKINSRRQQWSRRHVKMCVSPGANGRRFRKLCFYQTRPPARRIHPPADGMAICLSLHALLVGRWCLRHTAPAAPPADQCEGSIRAGLATRSPECCPAARPRAFVLAPKPKVGLICVA